MTQTDDPHQCRLCSSRSLLPPRPEETILYRLVQDHLETFLAEVEAGGAASLPQFVKDEFDAFLECGSAAAAGAPPLHGMCAICRN